nr:MAG TPA: hypothetical protein [Crassvirales sp.]
MTLTMFKNRTLSVNCKLLLTRNYRIRYRIL